MLLLKGVRYQKQILLISTVQSDASWDKTVLSMAIDIDFETPILT